MFKIVKFHTNYIPLFYTQVQLPNAGHTTTYNMSAYDNTTQNLIVHTFFIPISYTFHTHQCSDLRTNAPEHEKCHQSKFRRISYKFHTNFIRIVYSSFPTHTSTPRLPHPRNDGYKQHCFIHDSYMIHTFHIYPRTDKQT